MLLDETMSKNFLAFWVHFKHIYRGNRARLVGELVLTRLPSLLLRPDLAPRGRFNGTAVGAKGRRFTFLNRSFESLLDRLFLHLILAVAGCVVLERAWGLRHERAR